MNLSPLVIVFFHSHFTETNGCLEGDVDDSLFPFNDAPNKIGIADVDADALIFHRR
jgi:hypothetical protein